MVRMSRLGWLLALCVFTRVAGQDASPDLPASLRGLSAREFVAAAEPLVAGGSLSDESLTAIAGRAVELLLVAGYLESEPDYGVLLGLQVLAGDALTPDQQSAVRTRIAGREDDLAAMPYVTLRQKTDTMYGVGQGFAEACASVAAWVERRASLDDIPEDAWPWVFNHLSSPWVQKEFSIVWTGTIAAPQTGDYQFSPGLIDVNVNSVPYFVHQRVKLAIDNQVILNSTPDAWVGESDPIRLTRGQAVPIRLEVAFEYSDATQVDSLIHARLLWRQGKGAYGVVPASSLASGGKSGLSGLYRASIDGREVSVSRQDASIDFVWHHLRGVMTSYRAAQQKAGAAFFTYCSDGELLAACEQDPQRTHPLIAHPDLCEFFSTEERATFARELQSRPALVAQLSIRQVWHFYRAFRWGDADAALGVVGVWCQQHADFEPAIDGRYEGWFHYSRDTFFRRNREVFRWLPIFIYMQYPAHMEQLEQDYLVLADGRCCLPVAYTLAYAHLFRGTIAQWIEKLDAQLADSAVVGDRRVNWLLARAQAEEIKRCRPNIHRISAERHLAGRQWLEEASLVAESDAVKTRAAGELFVRHALLREQAAADAVLARLEGESPGEERQQRIAAWRSDWTQLQEEDAVARDARLDAQAQEIRVAMQAELEAASGTERAAAEARLEEILNTLRQEP